MAKTPHFPQAPATYSSLFMNRFIDTLTKHLNQINNPGPIQATKANFSYFDGSAFVLGLEPTDTLNGGILAGATTVVLNDATSFAESGSAYILDGVNSDKIAYTGRTATNLTGVTGVVNAHSSGLVVVASARRGDVFADPLNENTLKIIP